MSWKEPRGMVRRCWHQGWVQSTSWMEMMNVKSSCRCCCCCLRQRKERHNGRKVVRWVGRSLMERRTMMKAVPELLVQKCSHCCPESVS